MFEERTVCRKLLRLVMHIYQLPTRYVIIIYYKHVLKFKIEKNITENIETARNATSCGREIKPA